MTTPTNASYIASLQARARAEGIVLTPAGEPLFARDLARFQALKIEVGAPTPEEVEDDAAWAESEARHAAEVERAQRRG